MKYVSTRGQAPALSFEDVLLGGLAPDGGLYMPEVWPQWSHDDLRAFAGMSYPALTARVLASFTGEDFSETELTDIAEDAYGGFDHAAVAPLRQLDSQLWLMELFHGPTLAFKDLAMQVLGHLFDRALKRRGTRLTIVGATSGDTGSAAIEACRERDMLDVFILYPHGRVSEVQRRQMTTVTAPNVHAIAVEGTFDHCQAIVKALFNDAPFRGNHRLSAVNSINWIRVAAQIVYYVAAAVALGAPERRVAFAVPTGNFGNAFAGYAARRMGLPVEAFMVGSNRNDILARFFHNGEMVTGAVHPTLSPSMDIQVSSNFERLLFEALDRDTAAVASLMEAFARDGRYGLAADRMKQIRRLFSGHRLDDAGTKAEIAATYQATGMLVDPHTAVGLAAARAWDGDPTVSRVALATAHPAKFPDAVVSATGIMPALPESLADLHGRPERVMVLPNDIDAVKAFIAGHRAAERAA